MSETYTEEEQEEFLADRRESYSSDDAEDEFNPEFPDSKSMSELFEYITVYTPESFDLVCLNFSNDVPRKQSCCHLSLVSYHVLETLTRS